MARRKKQNGRPPKVEEAGRLVIQAIEMMNTITDACDAAGVATSTYRTWMKMGRQNPGSVYGTFCRDLATAKARSKVALVGSMFRNALKDGNQALRIAERKWPAEWGKPPEHVEVSGKENAPPISVSHDLAVAKMMERFQKMEAERLELLRKEEPAP